MYVYFFEQIFQPIRVLYGSVRLLVFGCFHPIRTLFGPVRLLKSSDFVSSSTEEQSIEKNVLSGTESRFYSVENAPVRFELFPFFPSAQSSRLNGIAVKDGHVVMADPFSSKRNDKYCII